jgi:hypothetical protein
MSRTRRKTYRGAEVRDGTWGRRCPDRSCPYCLSGRRASDRRRAMAATDEMARHERAA